MKYRIAVALVLAVVLVTLYVVFEGDGPGTMSSSPNQPQQSAPINDLKGFKIP